jgi:hypothetical protein
MRGKASRSLLSLFYHFLIDFYRFAIALPSFYNHCASAYLTLLQKRFAIPLQSHCNRLQSLCDRFAIASRSLRESLRYRFIIASESLCTRFAIASPSLRYCYRPAIVSLSFRDRFVIAPISLWNSFAIATEFIQNRCEVAAQSLTNRCEIDS